MVFGRGRAGDKLKALGVLVPSVGFNGDPSAEHGSEIGFGGGHLPGHGGARSFFVRSGTRDQVVGHGGVAVFGSRQNTGSGGAGQFFFNSDIGGQASFGRGLNPSNGGAG